MIISKCTIPTRKNITKYKKVYQSRYTFAIGQNYQEIRQAKSKHESLRKHDVIIQNKLLDKKQSLRVNDLQKVLKTKTKIREASTSNVPINKCDGDNINVRIDNKEDIKQSVEHDTNNNNDVKDDVVSSSHDNASKDDNDNIYDIEVEDFNSTVPINECNGDNIDARVVDEKKPNAACRAC